MGIRINDKGEGVFEVEIRLNSSYADIRDAIREKLAKNKDFFSGAGAKVCFSGRVLSEAQKKDMRRMMRMDYDVINVAFADEEEESVDNRSVGIKVSLPQEEGSVDDHVNLVSKNYFNAKSVFVSQTLRSGQRVECEGDVVVLGDVNDGAEVMAGGSIAVMGTLRGLVHAGATGRGDVVVAANVLKPKQLRISGKIAVFPSERDSNSPEIAEFRQGSIVIKPIGPLNQIKKRK